MAMDERSPDPLFLQRTLTEYVQAFAALSAATWGSGGAAPPDAGALQQAFAAGYQRLVSPTGLAAAGPSSGSGAAFEEFRRAASRSGELAASIAQDAGRRLAEALAASGPKAPPVTSLRELQSLWIDCGEAAYAEAARSEEFAVAQAELLMALVELRAVSS
jgi:hypothetical protein